MLLSKDDLANLVRIRKELHSHPETGFAVQGTRRLVIDELVKLGYDESSVVTYADPGFAIDIAGTGPAAE
jgi:metal-dependent amidase/aminoacylase/carboxypeptidase family protein